jgi:hypothetical protein
MNHKYILTSIIILILVSQIGCGNKAAPNQYSGKYSGTFSGATSGTWTAEIKKDGSVTAIMIDPDVGQFKLIGSISQSGEFAGGGGVAQINRVSWKGQFKIENDTCTCTGTWESSTGPTGTWEGQKDL